MGGRYSATVQGRWIAKAANQTNQFETAPAISTVGPARPHRKIEGLRDAHRFSSHSLFSVMWTLQLLIAQKDKKDRWEPHRYRPEARARPGLKIKLYFHGYGSE